MIGPVGGGDGTVTVSSGGTIEAPLIDIQVNGLVFGDGTFVGEVQNGGEFHPGGAIGTATVDGAYNLRVHRLVDQCGRRPGSCDHHRGGTAAAGVVTVTLIADVTFNNLRVLDGAQLLVTGGDLTVTESILVDVRPGALSGTTFFVGADDAVSTTRLKAKRGAVIEVEGGAAININEAFTLDRGGTYRKRVGAVDSTRPR